MAEETTMSPADVMAMMNNNGNWNNNPFLWLIFLAMMGNGNFGWGNNGANAALNEAGLANGLNNQTVLNDLRNIETGISGVDKTVQGVGCDIGQQICSGLSSVNLNTTNGFNNVGMSILQNTNTISKSISDASAAQQLANCQLSHAIQDNKFEITNAIHAEGEMTRGMITQNTIQDLRDKLAAKNNELQSAQLTLANSVQTKSILESLGKFVPYTSGCCGSSW